MNDKRYDLIVAGGGFAGTAAALAAAREGLKVLLFDKGNSLGGAAVNCLVNPFMPYWTLEPDDKRKYLSQGIFAEIIRKLDQMGAIKGETSFLDEYLKLLLMRMLREAGAELLFHSYLTGANVEGEKIKSVIVANKSGNLNLEADYFIDATGDGDLSVLCGCPYKLGRDGDELCQPMTLCFRLGNVDKQKYYEEK